MFHVFQNWCEENGHVGLLKRVTIPSHLSRELKDKVTELADLKPFREHGEDRVYLGIRLKTRAELRGEPEPVTKNVAEPEPKAEAVKIVRRERFIRRL